MIQFGAIDLNSYEMKKIIICYDLDYETNVKNRLTGILKLSEKIANHIIGYLVISSGREVCDDNDEFCITSLYIDSNFRRQGLATKMVKFAEKIMLMKLRPERVVSDSGDKFFSALTTEIRKIINEIQSPYGTKVVDKKNNPLIVYHSTKSTFDKFNRWSHFGTLRAAKNRQSFLINLMGTQKSTFRIKGCYINIRNPLYLTDGEANDEAILRKNVLNGKYDKKYPQLRKWANDYKISLEDLGYDGIIYKNIIEDEGKNSYIVFDPNNIMEIETEIRESMHNNTTTRSFDDVFKIERRGFHIYISITDMNGNILYERKFKNMKEAMESYKSLKKYLVVHQGNVPEILEKWQNKFI